MPLKNISSEIGPMTPPTRKNMKICRGAEGSGVYDKFQRIYTGSKQYQKQNTCGNAKTNGPDQASH